MSHYTLGLDSSTQSLTAILLDIASGDVAGTWSLNFDRELAEYGTSSGVLPHADPRVKHAPPLMWAAALDALFFRMQNDNAPLDQVVAVSGSGQQHGSVYLNEGADAAFAGLDPKTGLTENLRAIFSRSTSPIWMDSSTFRQCQEITAAMGDSAAVAQATGSIAFERFTGPQIRKFFQEDPEGFQRTSRVALVSSFMASIMSGKIAPIDHGDASGMNLMDIRTRTWHAQALAVTADDLAGRLGDPVAPWSVLGVVSPYFTSRYGLAAQALSVVWSGDNPNSLIGLGLVEPGDWAVSLGTSDTMFGLIRDCKVDTCGEGHVFVAPTGDYMSLICFKNGSLARERVRDEYGLDWDGFTRAVERAPKGNDGKLLLPYFEPEIVPKVLEPGVRRKNLDPHDVPANCRAVIEAQMISMRNHSAWMGQPPRHIFATGGASGNPAILQVMADVHQCPVESISVPDSAALGAAMRAAHAWYKQTGRAKTWAEITGNVLCATRGQTVQPDTGASEIYDRLAKDYAAFEAEGTIA